MKCDSSVDLLIKIMKLMQRKTQFLNKWILAQLRGKKISFCSVFGIQCCSMTNFTIQDFSPPENKRLPTKSKREERWFEYL
jgi:hypothetical protein